MFVCTYIYIYTLVQVYAIQLHVNNIHGAELQWLAFTPRKPGESNSLCPLKVRDNLVDGELELRELTGCCCEQNGGSNGRSTDQVCNCVLRESFFVAQWTAT